MSPKWYPPTRIAAAAASIAVVGSLGAGAVALAQSDVSFDPRGYVSAYGQGESDAEKGYRANPTETDAAANRHEDESDDQGDAADMDRPAKDAFSELPQDTASGTTAVNVSGSANATGSVAVGGEGAGDEPGGTIVGPVVPGQGEGNGGGPAAPDTPSNPGQPSEPDKPDNPPAPAPDPAPDPTPDPAPDPDVPDIPVTPDSPSEGGYDVLPEDPTPGKNTEKDGYDITYQPVSDKNSGATSGVNPDEARPVIMQANSDDSALYTGQKLDAWKVFCSLNTFYLYNGNSYSWTCTKDEFDSYRYFRVDSFPEVVPETDFEITVSFRYNSQDTWHTQTITYSPTRSCVFVLSGQTDAAGNPVVLAKSLDATCNLLAYTGRATSALGYSEYGQLSHMLLNWKENGEAVDFRYDVTPGRHVLTPGDVAEVPSGLNIGVDFYFLDGNYQIVTGWGGDLCYLQRLSGISDWSSLTFEDDGEITLAVPMGVQSVDIDQDEFLPVDNVVIPSSTMLVNLVGSGMTVSDSFSLDGDSPFFSIAQDRVLATKDGTRYLGVPTEMEELTVPENVTQVTLQEGNDTHRIVLEATAESGLPQINFETLNSCNIIVADELLPSLIESNHTALEFGNGNTISVASNPDEELHTQNGMVYSDDTLEYVADIGSEIITVDGPHILAKGCLAGNTSVSTIVLSGSEPYTFEEGSLEGSSVSTIICSTEEQKASIEGQLATAGAGGDVQVTCARRSANGFSYYSQTKDGAPYTTLLSGPENVVSFDGAITDDDGNAIAVNAISPRAFANCETLQWVSLPESVSLIGSEAFSGCTNLQGAFIKNPDEITVEADAFSGCASIRYIASRAMQGNFDFDSAPNYDCVLYRPTGSDGSTGYLYNFQAFTEESGVFDFELVEQDDGNSILYGCDAEGAPWLALASGANLSGEVKLPSSTIEIFLSAFENTTGDFTINWEDLTSLTYVDGNAFTNSSVAGDVYIGAKGNSHISIASDAFTKCRNITSFTSESSNVDIASWSFSYCTSLKTVSIAGSTDRSYSWSINPGIFYGCTALESIEFTNPVPAFLSLYSSGFEFRFDGDDTEAEDAERIKLTVPAGYETAYLEQWVYSFAGYSGYDQLYSAVYRSLYSETGIEPTRVEVEKGMSAKLLAAENYLRQMMGLEQVDSSTFLTVDENADGYAFQTLDGETTLVSAPADATNIDLDTAIGDAYSSIVLGKDAFSNCKNLKSIAVSSKVSGIEPGAFSGCEGVEVRFPAVRTAQLLEGDAFTPFTFGAKIKLVVPEASRNDYLANWTWESIGLEESDLYDYARRTYGNLLFDAPIDSTIYAEDLNDAVNGPFMEQENYLRSLMENADAVETVSDLSSFYDAGAALDLPKRPAEGDVTGGDSGSAGETPGGESSGGSTSGGESSGSSGTGEDASGEAGGDAPGSSSAPEGGSAGNEGTANGEGATNDGGKDNAAGSGAEDPDNNASQESPTDDSAENAG